MLEPVQEPAGPHKLSGKNAESQQNGDGARSGGYDHYDANDEQSEAEHDSKVPLGLLDCPYHFSPTRNRRSRNPTALLEAPPSFLLLRCYESSERL